MANETETTIKADPITLLKAHCARMRGTLTAQAAEARILKHLIHDAVQNGGTALLYDQGEAIANSMLALRHIEDACMRIGKVLQYTRDGKSIYDQVNGTIED